MGTSRWFKAILPHKCTIETWTTVADDDFGQPVKVWGTLVADVKCRLRTLEAGRPWEVFSPTRGEMVAAEFQVFIALDSDTYSSGAPTFGEQARLVFSSSPYGALTLNAELVAVRTGARSDSHLEVYCNRAVP